MSFHFEGSSTLIEFYGMLSFVLRRALQRTTVGGQRPGSAYIAKTLAKPCWRKIGAGGGGWGGQGFDGHGRWPFDARFKCVFKC